MRGLGIAFVVFVLVGLPARGDSGPRFPTFGTGPAEIRVYTDYFCPPCQAIEPYLENRLLEIHGRGNYRITFIDMPLHRATPLYVKQFLLFLGNGDFQRALLLRKVLFQAAASNVSKEPDLVLHLARTGFHPTEGDLTPIYRAFTASIRRDRVNSTPSVVVENNGVVQLGRGVAIKSTLENLR